MTSWQTSAETFASPISPSDLIPLLRGATLFGMSNEIPTVVNWTSRIVGHDRVPVPRLSRKCMNSWFCDVDKPIRFFGHMNEDVSAYVTYGHRGQLFLTVFQSKLVQKPTQTTPGGMSDLYLTSGTYAKSFYTVMANPSCVQIGAMGDPRGSEYRIHHKINWHIAVPKIIDEKHRKKPS